MECPNCLSNTRSVGLEPGDEKRCSHCRIPLVVVGEPKRHWEIVEEGNGLITKLMKITAPKNPIVFCWGMFQFALVICSFFWFGWQVGLLMALMSVRISD